MAWNTPGSDNSGGSDPSGRSPRRRNRNNPLDELLDRARGLFGGTGSGNGGGNALRWTAIILGLWLLFNSFVLVTEQERGVVLRFGQFSRVLQPGPQEQLGFERLATVDHAAPGMRFNDGRCDRQGRFLAGTMMMNMAPSPRYGCVYSYQKSSGLTKLLDGFVTPNGMAFSPDGRTMYLSDSHASRQSVWAFNYDIESGTPSNRRLFIDMNPLPGRPDGAAIDEDGCYWICGNDAGLIHRFTPQGKLDRSLPVPVKKPAMCTFGGASMDTLFVTSIRPEGIDLSDQPLAGGVFALVPGVRGLPEPAFAF